VSNNFPIAVFVFVASATLSENDREIHRHRLMRLSQMPLPSFIKLDSVFEEFIGIENSQTYGTHGDLISLPYSIN
jgi:hypothetical protein